MYLIDNQEIKHTNSLLQNYEIILKNLRKIQQEENCGFKPIKPKLSDLELVSLNIAAEQKGIDSEYQLFREIKDAVALDEKIDIQNLTNGLLFLKFENGNATHFIKNSSKN